MTMIPDPLVVLESMDENDGHESGSTVRDGGRSAWIEIFGGGAILDPRQKLLGRRVGGR